MPLVAYAILVVSLAVARSGAFAGSVLTAILAARRVDLPVRC